MPPQNAGSSIGVTIHVTGVRGTGRRQTPTSAVVGNSMIKTASIAFALAIAVSMVVPILVTSQPAEAGCERVYTSSGWQMRCK
jgi:hypothetical protein